MHPRGAAENVEGWHALTRIPRRADGEIKRLGCFRDTSVAAWNCRACWLLPLTPQAVTLGRIQDVAGASRHGGRVPRAAMRRP
jgi:hypothetical protein